jgi:hypothetical protein
MPKLVLITGEVFLYSSVDRELVNKHSWSRQLRPDGAVVAKTSVRDVSSGRQRTVYLHRLIMGVTDPRVLVDHRDRNTLDCRRRNLRKSNHQTNAQNSKSRKGSSKYKGVWWYPAYAKWVSQIRISGKRKHLGYFDNEVLAAKAYDTAARQYHGAFARLNFPRAKEQRAGSEALRAA